MPLGKGCSRALLQGWAGYIKVTVKSVNQALVIGVKMELELAKTCRCSQKPVLTEAFRCRRWDQPGWVHIKPAARLGRVW